MQVPQSRVPPQPSEMFPQLRAEQVVGVQQVPLKQVWPVGQLQVSVFPQSPFGIAPHFGAWAAQLVGVQQAPKSGFAFPGGVAGGMHFRLQQLILVAHRWPSGLQLPSARAARGITMRSAQPAAKSRSVGVIRFARLGRDVIGFLRCASVTPTAVVGGCYQWG